MSLPLRDSYRGIIYKFDVERKKSKFDVENKQTKFDVEKNRNLKFDVEEKKPNLMLMKKVGYLYRVLVLNDGD